MNTRYPIFAHSTVVCGALVLGAIALASTWPADIFGQDHTGPALSDQESELPTELQLRWHFAPDDVFRVRMRINETVLDEDMNEFYNQRIHDYRWTVRSVDSDGTATIDVSFDRVRYYSEFLRIEYDSQLDDPMVGTASDDPVNPLLYGFRAINGTQFTIDVSPLGEVKKLSGAESMIGPMGFTPGDSPALPDAPVSVGDSWSVDTGGGVGIMQLKGHATYELVHVERHGKQTIGHIHGENVTLDTADLPSDWQLDPTRCKSRFDAGQGQIIDDQLTTQFRARLAHGKSGTVTLDAERRFYPRERPLATSIDSGEYAFEINQGFTRPITIGGHRVGRASSPINGFLIVNFYHTWSDTNEDGIPVLDELSGISTRFAESEPVNFVVFAVGLKDSLIHFDLVDAEGYHVGRNEIRISDNELFATRTMSGLVPGVYFFEFAMDQRHLIRIPVQIHSK